MTYHRLRIARITQETPDARTFVFDIPADAKAAFRYRAGQFLTFRIPLSDGSITRCYSLSSAPESDRDAMVTVKRIEGGRGSTWFHQALKEGDDIEVMAPAGRFVLTESKAPLLLFAAGSGITPVVSLIKSALKTTDRPIRLFYANRDSASAIFSTELENLCRAHGDRVEVIHHWDTTNGFATAADIRKALEGFETGEAYLCGPEPFMGLVEETLLSGGVPESRVRVEHFQASENAAVASALPLNATDATPEIIVVHLDGQAHQVPYGKGQSILNAVREAGLQPASSCEDGYCGTCAAKTIKGQVTMVKNDVFTDAEVARGCILTCQSLAFGTEVELTYDET